LECGAILPESGICGVFRPKPNEVSGIYASYTSYFHPNRAPAILGQAGMDRAAVFVATCLASAIYPWL
jgi:hypothetical protein